MTFDPKKFGKYVLLDRLAVGGMAELFRAKITGKEGFEKMIVIKRMLPQAAKEKGMVSAFIDEAKLGALLQHENIIHTYDFGEIDGFYYMAMEYLFGKDLHSVIQKFIEEKKQISLENILLIISKICEGMEYAHTLTDLRNNPLNIIHRDISPRNTFITYDGKIKVIDFGIAKSTAQTDQTMVGLVKGKMSYMSPEQIDGKKIDLRTDIFSIGILLYEMLTHHKMYTGDGVELFKQVMKGEFTPPEKLVQDLPAEMVNIVNKALEKDPDKRFSSCFEMQKAIDDFLFHLVKRPNSKDFSVFIRDLFQNEYEQDKAAVSKIICSSDSQPTDISMTEHGTNSYEETALLENSDITATLTVNSGKLESSSKESSQTAGKKKWALLAGILIAVFVLIFLFFQNEPVVQIVKNEDPIQELPEKETVIDTQSENQDVLYEIPENNEKVNEQPEIKPEIRSEQKDVPLKKNIVKDLPENKRIIVNMLKKASERIGEYKLTTPENDCAVYYYRRVFKIDPDNKSAKEGLNKIGDQYASMAQKALNRFDSGKAGFLVEIGLEVTPQHEELNRLKQELKKKNAKLSRKDLQKNSQGAFE